MAIDIIHLTEQAKAGDPEAFGAIYEHHAGEMYRYALYVLGSESLAQDAVQDAALSAYRNIRSLRDPALLRAWLLRILSNRCKRLLRGKYKAVLSLEEQFCEPAALDPSLEHAFELRQTIASLPGAERDILLLSILGGYDSQEIAQTLGIPPGTVRSKRSRALAKLRKEQTEHD